MKKLGVFILILVGLMRLFERATPDRSEFKKSRISSFANRTSQTPGNQPARQSSSPSIRSKFQNEKTIPFGKLSTTCADLLKLQVAVSLRVNGDGHVIEATPYVPTVAQADIPPTVLKCKIDGGGSDPYVTAFFPSGTPPQPSGPSS